jgi:hypothetical protein
LNTSLQSTEVNIVEAEEKDPGILRGVSSLGKKGEIRKLQNFLSLIKSTYIKYTVEPKARESAFAQLENMRNHNRRNIPTGSVADVWVRGPFTVSLEQIGDTDLAKDDHLDLRSSQKLRTGFESMKLDRLWYNLGVYPSLTMRAFQFLLPFVTT